MRPLLAIFFFTILSVELAQQTCFASAESKTKRPKLKGEMKQSCTSGFFASMVSKSHETRASVKATLTARRPREAWTAAASRAEELIWRRRRRKSRTRSENYRLTEEAASWKAVYES